MNAVQFKFAIGDVVRHSTCEGKGVVTAVLMRGTTKLAEVRWSLSDECWHQEWELELYVQPSKGPPGFVHPAT